MYIYIYTHTRACVHIYMYMYCPDICKGGENILCPVILKAFSHFYCIMVICPICIAIFCVSVCENYRRSPPT